MYQSIIFDMDGVIINSEIVSYRMYQELLAQYQHDFALSDYAQNYSGKNGRQNMENLIKNYQLPLSLEEGLDFVTAIEEQYIQSGIETMSGVYELLTYLRDQNYEISLASSSIRDRAVKLLTDNNIIDFFDHLTFGPEISHGKPAPDIFLLAHSKTHAPKDKTLVIEDSEAGLQAAFAAGIPAVCVPDMKKPSQKLLDQTAFKADSLADVLTILQSKTQ